MSLFNDPWQVEMTAKMAKLRRTCAALARREGKLAIAMHHERLARESEAALRDFADSIEYDNLYAVTLKACGGAQYLPS